MDALERSTEFNRSITVQNVGVSTLDSRITSIDGCDPDRSLGYRPL